MKQFDSETHNRMIAEGKTPKVVTRDGRDVRILCTDRKYEGETIIALMYTDDGDEGIRTFYSSGKYLGEGEHENDLFFADLEPTYRPYKDAEECFKDVVKHGGWVKEKETNYYLCIGCVGRLGVRYADSVNEAYDEFLHENVWADDGTPCGVKEEEV